MDVLTTPLPSLPLRCPGAENFTQVAGGVLFWASTHRGIDLEGADIKQEAFDDDLKTFKLAT